MGLHSSRSSMGLHSSMRPHHTPAATRASPRVRSEGQAVGDVRGVELDISSEPAIEPVCRLRQHLAMPKKIPPLAYRDAQYHKRLVGAPIRETICLQRPGSTGRFQARRYVSRLCSSGMGRGSCSFG
jgi:hypothetical protein